MAKNKPRRKTQNDRVRSRSDRSECTRSGARDDMRRKSRIADGDGNPEAMHGWRKSKDNDAKWYGLNEQLLKDAASFPYAYPLGNIVNLGTAIEPTTDLNGLVSAVPGVMAIYTSPTIGRSNGINSPINVANRNLYANVRFANSGSALYNDVDLGIYMLAMDSAHSMLAFMRRIYGVMRTYSVTNRYYPKAVIAAMNVEFDDINANLADFRAFVNMYAVKLGSMAIPASTSYMLKHMWMYDGLYADSDTDKAQTYLFVPHAFYKFRLATENDDFAKGSGMLQYLPVANYATGSNGDLTFANIRALAEDILNPIIVNEDMNIMSGDIIKAYHNAIVPVNTIAEDYTVLPTYSEEVLAQIENTTLIGYYNQSAAQTNGTANIGQVIDIGGNYLYFDPEFADPLSSGGVFNGDIFASFSAANRKYDTMFTAKRFINMHHGSVTPAETMEASRMTNIISYIPTGAAGATRRCRTMGSEVAHAAVIFYYTASATNPSETIAPDYKLSASPQIYYEQHFGSINSASVFFNFNGNTFNGLTVTTGAGGNEFTQPWSRNFATVATLLSQFDWHPAVFPVQVEVQMRTLIDNPHSATTVIVPGIATGGLYDVADIVNVDVTVHSKPIMDLDVYTVVDVQDLEMMSEVALLSQFWAPQAARPTSN